jgi:hypothetical protein
MQTDSKSQPLAPAAPKVISKLVKLEREISGFARRVRGGTDRARPRLKKRRTIAAFFTAIKQDLMSLARLSRGWRAAITASARKLIRIAIQSGSLARTYKRNVAPPLEPPLTSKPTTHRTNAFPYFLISACLGVVSLCVAMIVALFLQIRDLKIEVVQTGAELAATKSRLVQLEKITQQATVKEATPIKKAQAAHPPLSFSEADVKVIRQSIKVLPPKPGALQKFHLGDEIADSTVAPIPASLVDQLPKLRGARFSIDQDGAIIIIGEGSNRVDAVLSYH